MKVKLQKTGDNQKVFTGRQVQLFHDDGTPCPMDDTVRVEIDVRADCIVEARVTYTVSELGMIDNGE